MKNTTITKSINLEGKTILMTRGKIDGDYEADVFADGIKIGFMRKNPVRIYDPSTETYRYGGDGSWEFLTYDKDDNYEDCYEGLPANQKTAFFSACNQIERDAAREYSWMTEGIIDCLSNFDIITAPSSTARQPRQRS